MNPVTATGTVVFKAGAITLGTGALSSGSATFSTSALIQGENTIVALYEGNATHSASTSPTLTQTVFRVPLTKRTARATAGRT